MDNSYMSEIDKIIQDAIKDTLDFRTIIGKSTGIHPIEVLNSIKRLYDQEVIDHDSYQALIKSAAKYSCPEFGEYLQILPVPHQMDFDWRFSNKGVEHFAGFIDNEIIKKGHKIRIAFIGSPSLFRYYCVNNNGHVELYLIDFNANNHMGNFKIPKCAHILECNLHYNIDTAYEVESIQADLIVMDPPWYPEYYKKFFEIADIVGASQCTVIGVSPPILTRDTITQERAMIDLFVRKLGFNNLEYVPACIEYYTPPFEKNVFWINGINNYPACWRKGDFFLTKRGGVKNCHHSEVTCLATGGSWTEKRIGIVRIKIRQDIQDEDIGFGIRLNHIYKSDIYPSVSRRFKGYDKINVWTSGNRVFYCTNIPVLFMIIERLNEKNIVDTLEQEYGEKISVSQKDQIEEVRVKLLQIIEMEQMEYGLWIE